MTATVFAVVAVLAALWLRFSDLQLVQDQQQSVLALALVLALLPLRARHGRGVAERVLNSGLVTIDFAASRKD